MKICGIIVEYNPFTYGHLHHIEQARSITNCDVLVAIMSGNFVQRGEVAVIDKWSRSEIAIKMGVDLVIELPYIYSNQSASQFASGAIELLKLIRADYLVFGSESNHLENLQTIADLNIKVDHLKESMKTGESFVRSYSLLQGHFPPNDILAIAYLKALKTSTIQPYTIQRTTDYHDETFSGKIASATSVRLSLKSGKSIDEICPMQFDYYNENAYYFSYLKQQLLTLPKSYLSTIFLVSEGIENHLIRCVEKADNYDDFIQSAITRRYTKTRIQRVLMNILNHISVQETKALGPLNYIRPLAFNTKGQHLLAHLKTNEDLIIASRFNKLPENYRKMEYKATLNYCFPLSVSQQKKILAQELQGPLIIKSIVK